MSAPRQPYSRRELLPQVALDDTQRLACLRLIRSENVGPVTWRELINLFGGATSALEALPELSRRGGRGKPLRICPKDKAEAELEAAHKIGARPLFTIEPGYPPALAFIEHPPPLLYVKGRPELFRRAAVGIVGSREASAHGMSFAREMAGKLGAAGLLVVSGMARGIDAAAHEASLATGTVAVLAGGIDVIYPPEHASLYERISDAGVVVTENWPGYTPRAQDFPRRNRIISGISRGVVIVEAARRSGTLTTARHAAQQGRDVFAVPGHPRDPRSEGTNHLLKEGAILTLSAEDVLEALRPQLDHALAETAAGVGPLPPGGSFGSDPPVPPQPASGAPDVLRDSVREKIVGAMGPAPIAVDELAREVGVEARVVQVALVELTLAGRLERHAGGLVSLRPVGFSDGD